MSTLPQDSAPDRAKGVSGVWSAVIAQKPERAAICASDGSVTTYGELVERARRTAGALHTTGIGRGAFVGVCLPLGADLVVAALAVLRCGAVYVPLDPAYPDPRMKAVIADAGLSVVLTDSPQVPRMHALGMETVALPDVTSETPPAVRIRPHDTAYVVYTSGSTGTPKGVLNSHGALDEVLSWMASDFPLHFASRVLMRTTSTFDVSIVELFWPLVTGATLVVPEHSAHHDPEQLALTIARGRVTDTFLVPSLLPALLAEPALAECATLRRILFIGEPLPPEHLRRLNEVLAGAAVFNTYGPSEAAVVNLWHRCTRADAFASRVPIGRPAGHNTAVIVRPGTIDPVAPGEPGELVLGGPQVASGYHRRPELTAEKFVDGPDGRLYRTGDVVVERGDGAIEFVGRADRQVKVRGCRVELDDVEASALSAPFISAAVADTRIHPQDGSTTLVAWVVADSDIDSRRIRDHMTGQVPAYMVPDLVVMLPEIPLQLNGKLNRSALPDPFAAPAAPEQAPTVPLLRLVEELWAELSGSPTENPDEAFLDSGGNSLLLLKFRTRLRSRGYPMLRVLDLLDHPTPRKLAAFLDRQDAAPAPQRR
ncbi:non-ribosomal peptide synthetase [Amycolatopsis azurea]|uniref:Long-chain-fatty-acid--CoA ligase n=1 Tax=Amycolatopsis azurea DSM 43854 TaxID=1238180 RepID=M2NNG0_9PSEU|nr:non-ribosomal peptide synthetase [Amycolatopsis azurea]EMD23719.1 Long-chain-fatty-acid--CoA ligase [Amycolatopsis azurea DSM 43854]OOC02955.1 hypothetical protein B0293_28670 [Amycolatopsis azurea DSM 43854]